MHYDAIYTAFISKWTHPKYPPKKVNKDVISSFEEALNISYPESYTYFLEHYGSCDTKISLLDAILENDDDFSDVSSIYSLQDSEIISKNLHSVGVSENFLAFAVDCTGNKFCFNKNELTENCSGGEASVWFYDRDFETLNISDDSFYDFVNKYADMDSCDD